MTALAWLLSSKPLDELFGLGWRYGERSDDGGRGRDESSLLHGCLR